VGTAEQAEPKSALAALPVTAGALELGGIDVAGAVVPEEVPDPLELHAAMAALSATAATAAENKRVVLVADMSRSLLGEMGSTDGGGRATVRGRRSHPPGPRRRDLVNVLGRLCRGAFGATAGLGLVRLSRSPERVIAAARRGLPPSGHCERSEPGGCPPRCARKSSRIRPIRAGPGSEAQV
jgi:hypothetical protein